MSFLPPGLIPHAHLSLPALDNHCHTPSVTLYNALYWTFPVNGIKHSVASCLEPLSLFLNLTHDVISYCSPILPHNSPLCTILYTLSAVIWLCHGLCVCAPADDIYVTACIWSCKQSCQSLCGHSVSFLLEIPRSGVAGSCGSFWFSFFEKSKEKVLKECRNRNLT